MGRKDKGRNHKYPKKRKSPRPHKVKSHSRGFMGSLWGDEKGIKAGKLMTDKDQLKLGDLWGNRRKK